VQDVTCYLLGRIHTLRHVHRSLFLTAVKRAAVARVTKGWRRHIVTMAPDDLAGLEKLQARPGRVWDAPVRLPAPVT